MSVLFKSPSNSIGNIGGTSTGFPPGDVSNITRSVSNRKILIRWQDPEDTIVDNVVFVKWKGTILIRNKDHYPTSIKDGDIVIDNQVRNKYKNNYYEDTNLEADTTYYYRFFTYTEDKVYNDSSNMIFKAALILFNPILKDNTWEQISEASESGAIPDTWKVGDEIELTLTGPVNETVTLQIWDFDHFDKSDGSGKAGICFGMKNLMLREQQMHNVGLNNCGWNNSIMRTTHMNSIYNAMPSDLKSHIKEVNTYANKGGQSTSIQDCKDKVFLAGIGEVGNPNWHGYYENQNKFPIFTDDKSRQKTKKLDSGSIATAIWWTRSPSTAQDHGFCYVTLNGTLNDDSGGYVISKHDICFCFNI